MSTQKFDAIRDCTRNVQETFENVCNEALTIIKVEKIDNIKKQTNTEK